MADAPEDGLAEAAPHFHGHRERLRARFREAGAAALADYELLELVLFRAIPRRDVKPIARRWWTVLALSPKWSRRRPACWKRWRGVTASVVTELKIVEAAAHRIARGQVKRGRSCHLERGH